MVNVCIGLICMIAIVFSTVGRNGVMGALSLRIFAIHGSTSCVREKTLRI